MKFIFLVAFVVALAAYSFDCGAAMTPEQAMRCCDSMPCSQGEHGQDCCNTMPSAHASFVQPTCTSLSFVSVVFAIAQPSSEASDIDSANHVVVARLHAHSASSSPGSVPLRI
jgi:hypothetical protein